MHVAPSFPSLIALLRRTLCTLIGVLALSTPAWAIPAFARRYKVDCVFCHDGFPKLNSAGQKFKERGFRLEHEDEFTVRDWIRTVPIILRGSVNHSFTRDLPGSGATVWTGKVVSAGNLGTRVSYWADDAYAIADGEGNHVKPDNAWARVEVLTEGRLYARGGRLELDLPFTQARTPHLFSYEVYFANTGTESDSIAQHKDGVEIGGSTAGDTHWSVALVKGHNVPSGDGLKPAVFARLAQWLGHNRVGAFAYIGTSTIGGTFDDHVLRLGADANVRWQALNLYGTYIHGRNDNSGVAAPLNGTTTELARTFDGGFAQADYRVHPRVVLTARTNVLSLPNDGSSETLASLYPGIQVFILEHGKLSFEYGFQNKSRGQVGAVQAEFAF
jgi:hypothetical protein